LSSNDISLGSSVSVRVAAEISLQALALKGGLSETFSKIVLRAVASAMTSVAHNRNDHLLIGFVVCENGFETFGQSEKFALSNGRSLQHLGLNLGQVEVAAIHAIVSVPASVALEETVVSLAHQSGSFLVAHVIVFASVLSKSLVASAEVVRLSHGLGENALLGVSLVFVHEFSEVRVITRRDHFFLFDESAEVSRSEVLSLG